MGYRRYNVTKLNLKVFCAVEAKNKGRLIQTRNFTPGCTRYGYVS